MVKRREDTPVGVLNRRASEKKFRLERYFPSRDLAEFIEHYWTVCWDLRGQEPFRSETLPHPSVHLVFDRGKTAIFGVENAKFSYLLEDQGQVFGIRFKPGGFYPFIQSPVSRLTNKVIPIEDAFQVDHSALEHTILAEHEDDRQVALVEEFLRSLNPQPDEKISLVGSIVDWIITHREVTRVEHVADWCYLSKRTLERLFSQYVGVSPKWVINRYRLQEAAELLASGTAVDWPSLAVDLGYFDQAHFIKDFKAIIGLSPAEYAKKVS